MVTVWSPWRSPVFSAGKKHPPMIGECHLPIIQLMLHQGINR
ncbi:hypothetical protein D082_10600 [Synechocystis sp. PCC 6714]|nr:hypothetical protein D082_10600 [Synechocystis sp. PCC 6714]